MEGKLLSFVVDVARVSSQWNCGKAEAQKIKDSFWLSSDLSHKRNLL